MTQGRSIRLFLVDGTPNRLLSAEIMNCTGHLRTGQGKRRFAMRTAVSSDSATNAAWPGSA